MRKRWNLWEKKQNEHIIFESLMVPEREEENKHSLNAHCMPPTFHMLLFNSHNIPRRWVSVSSIYRKENQKTQKGKAVCPRSYNASLCLQTSNSNLTLCY